MDFTQVRKIIIPETDYYMGLLHLEGNTSQQTSPVPTPDNPQAINVVTGRQELSVNGNSYEVNLGKNLFDGEWEAGQYHNGTWQPGAYSGERASTGLIPVTGGTYTISLNSDTLYTSFINLNYFDENKDWLGNRITLGMDGFATTDRVKTFTLPDTAYFLSVSIRPYENYTGDTAFANAPSQMLQVERGSEATSYASYFTPIELCKIGDYQDYIYTQGGKWYVHKEVAEIMLNGSESWTKGNILFYYSAFNSTNKMVGNDVISVISNYFIKSTYTEVLNSPDGRITSGNYDGALRIGYDISKTLAEFKTFLGNTTPTVYYVLATPTDTEITNSALIAQLDAIANLGHFSMTNPPVITVSATSPNLPAIIPADSLINDVVQIEQDGDILWEKP